ncbi:SpoIIE family protein phosphatase [Streptomyces sp. NBC_00829]|uniref:SpoIIE family protein phosphatase n=1 Tax=Streptomyces sp. NBC_00829 TaxID=2903679 RepID=UPI003867B253|nr:SpoIIE family protein phosphatase [Streptomyces sp. NBC_00829]
MRDLRFHADSGELPGPAAEADVLVAGGKIVAWSEGAADLLGYRAEEVLGQPADGLLLNPEDAESLGRRSVVDEAGRLGPVALRHRSGDRVDVELWGRPLASANGERPWLFQAARADTIRTYEFGRALLRGLFTDSPFLIDVFDTELRFVAQNQSHRGVTGFRGRELAGRTMREMAPPGMMDMDAFESRQRQVLDSGQPLIHTEVVGNIVPGGPPREYVWSESILPLKDRSGEVMALAHTVFDVTQQARSRERLALVNDASMRIGRTLDLSRTARELADVAVPRFADFAYVNLLDGVFGGDEPVRGQPPEAMLLRRVAHRSVLREGVRLGAVAEGEVDSFATVPGSPFTDALTHGAPVLLTGDELRVALAEIAPERAALAKELEVHSWLLVPMFARGAALGTAVFVRFRNPRRFETDDVLLAREFVARAAVCVDNARRYGRERSTALALQRSLLPQRFPSPTAVDAASRYLPASGHASLGGDWFDVIPLSGARVALVVGDVVGHDLHSAVTMGRLRTAVRTLADLGLPPDELLTHLDDQMNRFLDERGSEDVQLGAATGATCLYAVYDPLTRRCVMARAGHPPPAVLSADGEVTFTDLPDGPPLGLGGVVFESAEVELADGDLLVLYTDGLVRSRERDLSAGMELLRETLSAIPSSATPDDICDTLVRSLLPDHHRDDMALLAARAHGLPEDSHATWTFAADVELVARAREVTNQQLARWGLENEAFTTELIVSELVTNAIRHGDEPITLRLIRDRNLICEVSDGSNTSPHVRRARETDEGGRGLYLVAQLTQSWGTRYGGRGKTIWAEQTLSD